MSAPAWVSAAVLVLTALVHLLPLLGVLGGERLMQLYGLRIDDPALALLLRHRALLFGLLGVALLGAASRPAWHAAGLLAALISVGGFLLLAGAPAALPAPLQRVFWIDAALLPLLGLGLLLTWAPGFSRS